MKNSMVVFRKGDRFSTEYLVVECLEDHTIEDVTGFHSKTPYHVVIESFLPNYKPGDTGLWAINGFEYLGNFSKSDNFTSLYDKLNESTD